MLIFLHTKIYKNHVKEQVPYLCQKFQMVLHLQHHCETDLMRILKKSITPNIYEFQIQSFFLFGLRPGVVRNIFIITFVDKSCSWLRSVYGNTKWWGRLLSFNNCIRSWCQRFGGRGLSGWFVQCSGLKISPLSRRGLGLWLPRVLQILGNAASPITSTITSTTSSHL